MTANVRIQNKSANVDTLTGVCAQWNTLKSTLVYNAYIQHNILSKMKATLM